MTTPHLLIVGTGSIGERHLRCFNQTDRASISICEPNDSLREKMVGDYQVERAFANFEEALAEPFDAAVICTPANLHTAMAMRLVESGSHILIEKPLSTSLEDIDHLMKLVERKRRVAAVAYVLRMNPLLADMRAEIQSGRFGEPVQLVFQAGQHFPFYRPAYREIYYKDRSTGGGAIQDALTHGMNAAEWLIGPITEVAADADHQVLDGVAVEDTVHVIARHAKVMASYSLNQHQAPNETTFTVVCRDGTVRCELHRQRWCWQTSPQSDWTEGSCQPVERDELFVAQAAMFLDAIAGKCPPTCSLAEGLQTLRVNLAVLRAAETRMWQSL